jgi:histidinol-phosphate aminotransferase
MASEIIAAVSRFRRASLGDDFGYVPGEQPADSSDWLKLNTNESPLPPSPAVGPAMAAVAAQLKRYPDPRAEPLRSAIAAHHGVRPEQVFVGNGANQVIDCCFRAFCEPGNRVVWPSPTYSLFPVLARVFGCDVVEVRLEDDLTFPPSLGAEPGVLRFAVNPNSPTGVWMRPDALEEILAPAPGVVAIDEAYCDFAPGSCLPLLPRHEGWLVLRTFSKSHALAGLRVGYAVGAPELIADLEAVKDSYPVDRGAIAGCVAALEDDAHHRRIVATVVEQRGRLTSALRTAGWDVVDSGANFVFARPPDGDARAVQERLRAAHILVRWFTAHPDRLRISVGAPEEVDRLLAALV